LIARKDKNFIKISELICTKVEDLGSCISAIEQELKPGFLAICGLVGQSHMEAFNSCGFRDFHLSWWVFMIKDLEEKNTQNQFIDLFGINNDTFHMTALDYY
jgi:hypothetical protein